MGAKNIIIMVIQRRICPLKRKLTSTQKSSATILSDKRNHILCCKYNNSEVAGNKIRSSPLTGHDVDFAILCFLTISELEQPLLIITNLVIMIIIVIIIILIEKVNGQMMTILPRLALKTHYPLKFQFTA